MHTADMTQNSPGDFSARNTGSISLMPKIGVIGAGQLARMLAQAAISMNVGVNIFAMSDDEPAVSIAEGKVISTGDNVRDYAAVAQGVSALTFENEAADEQALSVLSSRGVNVYPCIGALSYVQDKLVLRQKLAELEIAQPDFCEIESYDHFLEMASAWNYNIVLKARRGGYDGRGVWICSSLTDCQELQTTIEDQLQRKVALMAEQKIPWKYELAAQIACSPFGQISAWPTVRTIQKNGQCAFTIAPAVGISETTATHSTELAIHIAQSLEVVGLMTVELFATDDGKIYVNELAMRPHNSGHWTMNGSVTSQFEQHIRAVLDYPLGITQPIVPLTVMANFLGARVEPQMSVDERVHHLMARMPDAKIHLYGKTSQPDRKLGHINFLGYDASEAGAEKLLKKAQLAATWMATAVWEDGWDEHHGNAEY